MAFKKGHKKTGGKKTGSINAKTKAWENLGDFFCNEGANRAKSIMMASEDKDYMNYYSMLAEFFKPKLARTELSGDLTVNQTISDKVIFSLKPKG